MKVCVDRIEGTIAVCIKDDGNRIGVRLDKANFEVHDGDVLNVCVYEKQYIPYSVDTKTRDQIQLSRKKNSMRPKKVVKA